MVMKFIYDSKRQGTGYYRCGQCEAVMDYPLEESFVHGGVDGGDCPLKGKGLDNIEYHFGDLEVLCLNKWGRQSVGGELTKEVLENNFPELVSSPVR